MMLEIEKGYHIVVRGRAGLLFKVVVYSVPAGSVEVIESSACIRLDRPRRELLNVLMGSAYFPGIVDKIEAELAKDDDESGFFYCEEFTNNFEEVRKALETVATRCLPDDIEGSERIRAVTETVAGLLTEIQAKEAYFRMRDQAQAQASVAANN